MVLVDVEEGLDDHVDLLLELLVSLPVPHHFLQGNHELPFHGVVSRALFDSSSGPVRQGISSIVFVDAPENSVSADKALYFLQFHILVRSEVLEG